MNDWSNLVADLETVVEDFGGLPVFVRVRGLRQWRMQRVWRYLPVERVEVSADTWEVRWMVPGLLRRNRVGRSPMSVEQFAGRLRAVLSTAGTFKLVVSDEVHLSKQGVVELAAQRGHEWTGPSLDSLGDEEYVAHFDIPIGSLGVAVRRQRLEMEVRSAP